MKSTENTFNELTVEQRLNFLVSGKIVDEKGLNLLKNSSSDVFDPAGVVENVIGTYSLPYSVIPNFFINEQPVCVPMVGEEPYVVKSTEFGAELAKKNGGFFTTNTGSIMIGQIQLSGISNPYTSKIKIIDKKQEIIEKANSVDNVLVSLGGGCKDVQVRILDSAVGTMLVVHLIIDVRDAMGAQAINAMTEAVSPLIESITGGTALVRVLSNLAVHRIVTSRVKIDKKYLNGEKNVDKIVEAWAFAEADAYRATTNNKGIMNGIIPVVIATGNDTRAVESGVHSYASISGRYRPLTVWEKDGNGDLNGCIELPLAVGIVGGFTKTHPLAMLSIEMMNVSSSIQLAEIMASVGLAANLGVLYSLTTTGLHSDFDSARK